MGSIAVVCVGHDKVLLQTRKLVLERDYSVATVTSLGGLAPSVLGEQVALVVLCHSLSRQQRIQAARRVRETWPQAKVLEMLSSSENQAVAAGSEVLLGLDGPVALLKKVAALLAVPPGHSQPSQSVEKRRATSRAH